VAEGGMPFIFSSLSSTSEALSHIFPAEARGLEAASSARRLDARLTENPAARALHEFSYAFPRRLGIPLDEQSSNEAASGVNFIVSNIIVATTELRAAMLMHAIAYKIQKKNRNHNRIASKSIAKLNFSQIYL